VLRIPETSVDAARAHDVSVIKTIPAELLDKVKAELWLSQVGTRTPGQIAERISRRFDVSLTRAETIVRTEGKKFQNYGAEARIQDVGAKARDLGIPMVRYWIHSSGMGGKAGRSVVGAIKRAGFKKGKVRQGYEPRPHHKAMHGVTVAVDEKFTLVNPLTLGKWQIDGPHDPILPAGEVVSCYCDRSVRIDREALGNVNTARRAEPEPASAIVPKPTPEPAPAANRFVPAKSVKEATSRLSAFVSPGGLNLPLPLGQMNSVLQAAEDILGPNGVQLKRLSFCKKSGSYYGVCFNSDPPGVELRKSFLQDPKSYAQRDTTRWTAKQKETERSLAAMVERLRDPRRAFATEAARNAEIGNLKARLERLKKTPAWSTISMGDDPVYCAAAHEFYHAVDKKLPHPSQTIRARLGDNVPIVSEYGKTSDAEYYAELGVAIKIGIVTDPEVIRIFSEATGGRP
jgi:hypothetical protein